MASLTARGTREIDRIKGTWTRDDGANEGPVKYFMEYALRSDGKILSRLTHVEYLNGYPGGHPPYNALKSNPNKIPHTNTWSISATIKPTAENKHATFEKYARRRLQEVTA